MHGGKVVTGMNHGEAFGKMSIDEQDNGLFTSGFLDPKTGEFVADEETFYLKQLILIRHSEIEEDTDKVSSFDGSPDPALSDNGRSKADDLACCLQKKLDLSGYAQFTGYATRCQETARIIDSHTNLGVEYLPWLQDMTEEESPIQFVCRLKKTLDYIPDKSLVVSHCNCVLNLAQLALGLADITSCSKWNGVIPKCSVTIVNGREAVWIGHELTCRT